MKRTLILVLLLLLLLAGCRQKKDLPPTTAAIWDVYQQYADRQDLTVTMIGGYKVDTTDFNLLMLRVSDSIAWIDLQEEFNLISHDSCEVNLPMHDNICNTRDSIFELSKPFWGTTTEHPKDNKGNINAQDSLMANNDSIKMDLFIRRTYIAKKNGEKVLKESVRKHECIGHAILADEKEYILWIFVFDSQEHYREQFNILLHSKNIIHQ